MGSLSKVYINRIAKYLPNNPISNDEMEGILHRTTYPLKWQWPVIIVIPYNILRNVPGKNRRGQK